MEHNLSKGNDTKQQRTHSFFVRSIVERIQNSFA